MASVTAISSGVRSPRAIALHDPPDASPTSAPRRRNFRCSLTTRIFGSRMRDLRDRVEIRTYVRLHPSATGPILRTHVPPTHSIPAHAPSAHCALSGPLVPVARGRLRRRLGGRPGRARPAGTARRSTGSPSAPARERASVAPSCGHPQRASRAAVPREYAQDSTAPASHVCLCPCRAARRRQRAIRRVAATKTGRPQATRS